MKRTILLLIVTAMFPLFIFAQDQQPARQYELGLRFSSLNSFGLNFKTGKKDTWFRISAIGLNVSSDKNSGIVYDTLDYSEKQSGGGAALLVGFEKRIPLAKSFNFIIGLDAGVACTVNHIDQQGLISQNYYKQDIWRVIPQAACVLGVSYMIKDFLVLSAELDPTLSYTYGKTKYTSNSNTRDETVNGVSFGLSSSSATITLAYRFGKK